MARIVVGLDMKTDYFCDNARPHDETYPTFQEPDTAYRPDGSIIYVNTGDYVINREGDIVIATTDNARWKDDTKPLADWNRGFFRAKYIGNRDDYLEFANQCRLATQDEIAIAKNWTKGENSYKIDSKGQLLLV